MFVQLNCVVVDTDPSNRVEMGNFLSNHGVNVVAQCPGVDQVATALGREDGPQMAVVNLDPNPHASLKKVGQLVRQFPSVSFFVLSQTVDPQLLMDAMHAGVKEFVPLPIVEEKFAAGIERIAQMHGMGKHAKIIHLIPTVGGCGSTTVACNVAAALARAGRTVLLDMDLIRGSVASSFDLRPRYTITDLMDANVKLDKQLLDNALSIDPTSGLAILARPEVPEDTLRVNQPAFARLLGILGRMFDYVVIDSLMSISPLYATAIDAADENIFVMQLNVPSAKNTERFIGALRRMGVDGNKMRVVVNRFVKKGWDIAPDEVERSLGLKISWLIPNDFKNAIAAINFGQPVVLRTPRADMSESLRGLAETITGRAAMAA